jgi:hypothetical protein
MGLGRAGARQIRQAPSGDILGCVLGRCFSRAGIRDTRILCCLCVVAALIGVCACAPAAMAVGTGGESAGGGSAFNELAEGGKEAPAETTPTTSTTESSATSSNSNTGTVLLLGLIAAAALIGGIAFVILRDARRVAPVPDGQVTGVGRPARDPASMMRRRRAKAKAARRQRKRNR